MTSLLTLYLGGKFKVREKDKEKKDLEKGRQEEYK